MTKNYCKFCGVDIPKGKNICSVCCEQIRDEKQRQYDEEEQMIEEREGK